MDDIATRRVETACAAILRRPLPAALAALCLIQLAAWLPGYLTWPWWADHDVFATMARAWQAGIRPYRDFQGNNFPATTYVFWLLGVTCGWGRTAPFWAFDAALVLAFGGLLLAWSRRRLGGMLPGLVGYALFLGYYLSLDYSQAAQRDWHAPFFAIAGLLIVQTWPGHAGRIAAGLAAAVALSFRPQAVLFLPGLILAVIGSETDRSSGRSAAAAAIEWALSLVAGLLLLFAPLVLQGLIPDFLRGLRAVGYGGGYNRVGPASFVRETLRQLGSFKMVSVPVVLALLWPAADQAARRLAWPWVATFAGVLLYRPISPVPHAYLAHPLTVVWSVAAALLAWRLLRDGRLTPSMRLAMLSLLLGLGVTAKPRFSTPNGCGQALADLWNGRDPGPSPPGYATNPEVRSAARYDWNDYRELLGYLRDELPPDTTVANALAFVPALAGPAGRLPAFPAESIAWLTVVHREDEERFAESLRTDPRAVVVWSPSETDDPSLPHLDQLTRVIRDNFQPHRRFGSIEVWTRPDSAALADRTARPRTASVR